ncbi:hypothetical protein ACG2LH_15630, partial [Zhouia sp. PK063]|uniref:hypothetical protein n=1 Tax=Zhouia sp. PK063 TaxID=3373602 RepID=UPI0037A48471
MTNLKKYWALLFVVLLAACQNEKIDEAIDNPTQSKDENLILNNDASALGERVSHENSGLVTLTNNQTASKGVYSAKTTDFSLALVA